jgi:type VI secretion system protein ImpF
MKSERHSSQPLPSVLDRLLDARPEETLDRPRTAREAVSEVRDALRRDIEALLNARRPWRSVPDRHSALRLSPLGYGLVDFTAGAFNDPREREKLRLEIEAAISRFEPRLSRIRVQLSDDPFPLKATLALRIDALLRMDPAPEPVSFDTMIDTTTADVVLRPPREI